MDDFGGSFWCVERENVIKCLYRSVQVLYSLNILDGDDIKCCVFNGF